MTTEEKHAQASKEIAAALPFLCGLEMPSTKHMEPGEKEDAIAQMLVDLHRLADEDGCIAAAWAFEFATNLRTALSASRWVSVKERMPTKEDACVEHWWGVIWMDRLGTCCEARFDWHNGFRQTHWMPIPPLPQQEG